MFRKLFMITVATLGVSAFAREAPVDCTLGGGDEPGKVLRTYEALAIGSRVTKVVFCQRTDGSQYVEKTTQGFPGNITTATDVVYQGTVKTYDDELLQTVTTEKGAILTLGSVWILRERKNDKLLESIENDGTFKLSVVGER